MSAISLASERACSSSTSVIRSAALRAAIGASPTITLTYHGAGAFDTEYSGRPQVE
ncbi:hypothetical protein [Streptomyces sp. Inha503]|uniref:hypothetical protein n=1 Tax=Streptomyces sp. Inha503 TaxID=3383314 RepID=UPI0039A094D1